MIIRKARITDLNKIVELEKKWIEEDISFGLKQTKREKLEKNLKEKYYWIAIDGNKTVGFIGSEIVKSAKNMPSLEISKGEKYGEILEVYVLKKYRKRKIGSKLIKEAMKNFDIESVEKIKLRAINKKPLDLVKYYNKFGFKERSVLMVKIKE
jgi:N-acetylglutamate synthase-like GNAT family acetyltransferase